MEQLLETIIKDTQSKFTQVHENAKLALNFLESYSKAPASDYRKKVLPVVTAALETGNNKLCQQTVSIIHKIGKDNRFHSKDLEEDQSCWLTQQVIDSLSPLTSVVPDLQTDYLQALLTLSYHGSWIVSGQNINNNCFLFEESFFSGQIVLQILTFCQEIISNTTNTITRAAAKNVAANTVSCLSRWLCRTENERAVEDVIPVLQYLCTKLEECFVSLSEKGHKKLKFEKEVLLCCLETSIRSLNKKVTESKNFCTFIWRSLCPAIIKLLVRGSGHSIVCALTSLIGE